MLYVQLFKIPRNFPDEYLKRMLLTEHNMERIRNLNKGLKLTAKEIMISGQHADDFVKNLETVRILYNAYKVPRFVKKHLMKNFSLKDISDSIKRVPN